MWILVPVLLIVATFARNNGVSADHDDKDFRFISYQGKFIYAVKVNLCTATAGNGNREMMKNYYG